MTERALALLLLNALWQPLAVAAGTYCVLKAARNASAATRCAVLTVGLISALLIPPGTTAFELRSAAAPTLPAPALTAYTVPRKLHLNAAPIAQTQPLSVQPAPVSTMRWNVRRVVFAVPYPFVLTIVIAWAIVAALLVLRLLLSMVHLARLRHDALPLSPEAREHLERWKEKTAGTNLRLCVSDETPVPIAVGFFDAMVLIPRHLVDELDATDLDRIVLHEIAHLRRRDSAIYVLQQIGCALFFFSPGLAWLARTLDVEREVACDDWVLERSGDAAPYASCLVRLAERAPWPHSAMPAPGAFVTRRSMSIRIERILHRARDARLSAAPGPIAAAVTAIAAVGIAGLAFAPSLAYSVAPGPIRQTAVIRVPKPQAPAPHRVHAAAPVATHAATRVETHVATRVSTHAAAHVAMQTATRVAAHAVTHVAVKVRTHPESSPAPKPLPSDDYIAQMRNVFGRSLSVEELVSLKTLDVTPEYVQSLRTAGYSLSADQIAGARAMGVTAQQIAQMRAAFGNLSYDNMMAMTSMHVDTEYRDQMQAAGLTDLTPERLIELKSLRITPRCIEEMNALGFGKLNEEQIVQVSAMHIDADFMQRVREHGFGKLTLEQVIQLKASGVIQ